MSNSIKKSKKKKKQYYKKIDYDLTEEELNILFPQNNKKNLKSKSLKLNETQTEIINKIKKKIKKFKKLKFGSNYILLHYHNNKKKKFDLKHSQMYFFNSTNKPTKTAAYNEFVCPESSLNMYTIYIFLDVDENLKNEGAINFYKPIKTIKKNLFGMKRRKTEYKEKNNFIPKTGDIIYVSGKTYHKFEDIKEKNKEIETKNRIFFEIHLCLDHTNYLY